MIETLLDLWGRPQSFCCVVIILQVSLNRGALCHCLLVSFHAVLRATCFLLQSLTSASILGDPGYMQFLLYAIMTKKWSSSLFKLSDSVIAGLHQLPCFIYSLSVLCFFGLYLKSFATLFCLPLLHAYVSSCAFLSKHAVFFSHPFFLLCFCPSSSCAPCFCSLCPLPLQTLAVL